MWIEERKGKNGDITYAYIERYTCPLSGKKKKVSVVYGNKSRLTQKQALMHCKNVLMKLCLAILIPLPSWNY